MKMVKYLYYWHKHIQFIRAALIMLGGKLVTSMKVLCFRVPCRESNFSCTQAIILRQRRLLFIGKVQQTRATTTTKTNNHIKCGNSPQMTDTVHFMILSRAYRRGSLYHSQLNYYTSIILYIRCTHKHTHFFCLFLSLMDYLAGETSTKLKKMSSCWKKMWKLEACWKQK